MIEQTGQTIAQPNAVPARIGLKDFGRPPRAAPNRLGAIVAGVVLAVVLAGGAVLWLTAREEATAPVVPDVVAVPTGPVPTAPSSGAAVPGPTAFVVASAEAAGELRTQLEPFGADQYGRVDQILVATTQDEFAQLQQFVTDLNRVRDVEGMASIALVDLRRGPAAGAAPAAGSAASWAARPAGPSTETVYVVASEEVSTSLHGLLSGADAYAAANGAPVGPYSVVVVEAGQDAAALFTEQQLMLASESLPALAIVDLRPAGRFEP